MWRTDRGSVKQAVHAILHKGKKSISAALSSQHHQINGSLHSTCQPQRIKTQHRHTAKKHRQGESGFRGSTALPGVTCPLTHCQVGLQCQCSGRKIVKGGLPFLSAGFCGQSAPPKRVSLLGKIENSRGGVLTHHEQTAFHRKPFFKLFQCPITGECYGGCSPNNIGDGLLMLSEMNGRYKGGEGKGLWGAGARPPFKTHSLRTRQVTSNRGRGGGSQ